LTYQGLYKKNLYTKNTWKEEFFYCHESSNVSKDSIRNKVTYLEVTFGGIAIDEYF
jgi:hypothetical protein